MAEALRDCAVRAELGIPRTTVAKLAGVDRRTVAMYEAGPQFVTEEKGAACRKVYELLRHVLEKMPGKRGR